MYSYILYLFQTILIENKLSLKYKPKKLNKFMNYYYTIVVINIDHNRESIPISRRLT